MRSLLLFTTLCAAACHPLAWWYPPGLGAEELVVIADGTEMPVEEVTIVVDDLGVPHIRASSDEDAAYAMGFMHARDRLFQILLLRAVAEGRLAELVGGAALAVDRQYRLVTHRVDEQVEALSPRDRALAESYAAGVNRGAKHAGPSGEMILLGATFEPFDVRDVFAIGRLQSWDLSAGLLEELVRARAAARIGTDSPVFAELISPCSDVDGVPVVRDDESLATPLSLHAPPGRVAPRPAAPGTRAAAAPTVLPPFVAALLKNGSFGGGGSNAWAVAGALTASGNAIVAHDPHLAHQAPSLFYLVHIDVPGGVVAGATVPGLPIVATGHGAHVAWGVPLSYADALDLVRIERSGEDAYVVDGVELPFEHVEQVFAAGADPGVTEDWLVTGFGPVLPPGFADDVDEGVMYAVQWPPFLEPEQGGEAVSAFWDLARAANYDEAVVALDKLQSPPLSFTMAFDDGSIGYFPSGSFPVRASDEPVWFPRDGSTVSAGFAGMLSVEETPRLKDPQSGVVVAANQPIVAAASPIAAVLGCEGATPDRAARIGTLVDELLADGPPDAEALLALQQDAVSERARVLGPVLAAACPQTVSGVDDDVVARFCAAVAGFDGRFDLDATGALPYSLYEREALRAIVRVHLGDDDARLVRRVASLQQGALVRAILAWSSGEQPAVLDDPDTPDYDGFAALAPAAAAEALNVLLNGDPAAYQPAAGTDEAGWRWGRVHKRVVATPFAEAVPVLGPMLFQGGRYPESGCESTCIRAESGVPVWFGANLRLIGDMGAPPDVRMILDVGQSGHVGHRHFEDHAPLWGAGTPVALALDDDALAALAEGRIRIAPR